MSCPIEAPTAGEGQCSARCAGEFALRYLKTYRSGRTVAHFANSVYVRFASGSFVCVGADAIGAGPLNVLLARGDWQPLQRLALGTPVEARAEHLTFADRYRIVLTPATRWRPTLPRIRLDALERQLQMLTMAAPQLLPDAGLSRLAFAAPSGHCTDPLLRHAFGGWNALERWIAGCIGEPILDSFPGASASDLIGLGPGLTPSGDDVFCGVLVALGSLGLDAARAALWSWLKPRIAERTSELSAAHLHAAAAGCGHSTLHAILACAPADASALELDLARLGRVGHCSGWDALAGVVLVWRAYAAHHASRRTASSAACAFDGATMTPARSSVRRCDE